MAYTWFTLARLVHSLLFPLALAAACKARSAQPHAGALPCELGPLPDCRGAVSCDFATERARDQRCSPVSAFDPTPFLARCGSYDAVVSRGLDLSWAVLYDPHSGKLAGSFELSAHEQCTAYDPGFALEGGAVCEALDGPCPCEPDASCPSEDDAGST